MYHLYQLGCVNLFRYTLQHTTVQHVTHTVLHIYV